MTPEKGLDIIDQNLKEVYREASFKKRFKLKKYPVAHFETNEMRKEALKFLNKWR